MVDRMNYSVINNIEINVIKHEIKNLQDSFQELKTTQRNDIKEIKVGQKELMEFMYKFQGGTAWMVGILTASATFGALLTTILNWFVSGKGM